MSKIKIELATLHHTNLIAVLGATTFYEAYCEQDESGNLANYIVDNFNSQQIADELKNENSTFLLAYQDDKAVGYAKLRENSAVECMAGENAIELQRIYTLSKVHGAGVGEKLLHQCLIESKKKSYQWIWLSVWQENLRARRFYEKQNFERAGDSVFVYGEQIGYNFVLKKRL